MKKKEKDLEVVDEKAVSYENETLNDMNASIDKPMKPSKEETEQFKIDFEKSLEDFHVTRWDISSEKGAFASQDVAIFLLDYIKKYAMWSKNGWMGMLKMHEEIVNAQKAITEEIPFSLDYQALEFCAYMLLNPGGVGLQNAKDFEMIADKYAKISMKVAEQQEDARKTLKEIAWKQERWAAAEQGMYLSELEPEVQYDDLEESEISQTGVQIESEKAPCDCD